MFFKKRTPAKAKGGKGQKDSVDMLLLTPDGLPPGLNDDVVRGVYKNKQINSNVNAMVYMHLGTKILDYLLYKQVINYGDDNDKTEEAAEIVKKNKKFINRMTLSHEKGETVDFESFEVEIQEQAKSTLAKLVALLLNGDKRLGGPEAELAAPVPFAVKAAIALCINSLMRFFDRENPYQSECDELIHLMAQEEPTESYEEFFDYLKAAIAQGNGTRTYRYKRLAVASIVGLMVSQPGQESIEERITDSLNRHGHLDGSLLSFDDLPQFQESFENLDCMFNAENLSLMKQGGGFAALAWTSLAYLLGNFETTPELNRVIDEIVSKSDSASGIDAEHAMRLSEREMITKFLGFLKIELASIVRGFIDGSDRKTQSDRVRALRTNLVHLATMLDAVANSQTLVALDGGEEEGETTVNVIPIEPADQQKIRIFCEILSQRFSSLTKHGFVVLSDTDIPRTDKRVPFYDKTLDELKQLRKDVRNNIAKSAVEEMDETFEMAWKLLLFHNQVAMHRYALNEAEMFQEAGA